MSILYLQAMAVIAKTMIRSQAMITANAEKQTYSEDMFTHLWLEMDRQLDYLYLKILEEKNECKSNEREPRT